MKNIIGDVVTIFIIGFIVYATYNMIGDINAGGGLQIPIIDFFLKVALWIMVGFGVIGNIILIFRVWFKRYEGYLFYDTNQKFHRIEQVRVGWGSTSSIFHIYFNFADKKKSERLHFGNYIEFIKTNKIMTEAIARKYYPHKLI